MVDGGPQGHKRHLARGAGPGSRYLGRTLGGGTQDTLGTFLRCVRQGALRHTGHCVGWGTPGTEQDGGEIEGQLSGQTEGQRLTSKTKEPPSPVQIQGGTEEEHSLCWQPARGWQSCAGWGELRAPWVSLRDQNGAPRVSNLGRAQGLPQLQIEATRWHKRVQHRGQWPRFAGWPGGLESPGLPQTGDPQGGGVTGPGNDLQQAYGPRQGWACPLPD